MCIYYIYIAQLFGYNGFNNPRFVLTKNAVRGMNYACPLLR